MTRTMYDAIYPANIPAAAQMVAGYVDGKWAWTPAEWARFTRSVKVRIAVFPRTNDGHVLDCEAGDATPAQCPAWVQMRRKAGVDPTVYTSYGNLGQNWGLVINEFHRQGVAEPHWWIAAYPGLAPYNGPKLYPGSIAHQYANPGPVDISVVADYWPGVDPQPAAPGPASDFPNLPTSAPTTPTPAPSAPLEDNMKPFFICRKSDGLIVIVGPTGVRRVDASQWRVWTNLGYTLAPGMNAMDDGPFGAVVASLGGQVS